MKKINLNDARLMLKHNKNTYMKYSFYLDSYLLCDPDNNVSYDLGRSNGFKLELELVKFWHPNQMILCDRFYKFVGD